MLTGIGWCGNIPLVIRIGNSPPAAVNVSIQMLNINKFMSNTHPIQKLSESHFREWKSDSRAIVINISISAEKRTNGCVITIECYDTPRDKTYVSIQQQCRSSIKSVHCTKTHHQFREVNVQWLGGQSKNHSEGVKSVKCASSQRISKMVWWMIISHDWNQYNQIANIPETDNTVIWSKMQHHAIHKSLLIIENSSEADWNLEYCECQNENSWKCGIDTMWEQRRYNEESQRIPGHWYPHDIFRRTKVEFGEIIMKFEWRMNYTLTDCTADSEHDNGSLVLIVEPWKYRNQVKQCTEITVHGNYDAPNRDRNETSSGNPLSGTALVIVIEFDRSMASSSRF